MVFMSSFVRTSGKLLIGRSSEVGRALKAGSLRRALISSACAATRCREARMGSEELGDVGEGSSGELVMLIIG